MKVIQHSDEGDFVFVAVQDKGKLVAHKVTVKVGLSYDGHEEILSGLDSGDRPGHQGGPGRTRPPLGDRAGAPRGRACGAATEWDDAEGAVVIATVLHGEEAACAFSRDAGARRGLFGYNPAHPVER